MSPFSRLLPGEGPHPRRPGCLLSARPGPRPGSAPLSLPSWREDCSPRWLGCAGPETEPSSQHLPAATSPTAPDTAGPLRKKQRRTPFLPQELAGKSKAGVHRGAKQERTMQTTPRQRRRAPLTSLESGGSLKLGQPSILPREPPQQSGWYLLPRLLWHDTSKRQAGSF